MNNNLKLDKKEIVNILLILTISISFLLLPWFKISEFFSITPLNGIFQYFNILNSTDFTFNLNTINFLFIVYLLSLYLILLFIGIAAYYLVRLHNNYQFNFYCRVDYIVNIVLCVISIILKYVISNQITNEINSNGFGFGGYVSSLISSVFTFGAGFYVILVCSLFGLLASYLFNYVKPESPVHIRGSSDDLGKNQRPIEEKTDIPSTDYFDQPNEYQETISKNSRITLIGNTTVSINKLPTVIGRNRELVDTVINEPSVSRIHCKLEESNGNVLITDLGSSFGTAVNDSQLDKYQRKVLRNNDILRLGDIKYRVLVNDNYIVPNRFSDEEISTNNSIDVDYINHGENSLKLSTEEIIINEDSDN